MGRSYFFYDLETSGFDSRSARIVQFGGQRTDMDLQPVGDPVKCYIKLTPDVLPDPEAVLITGITPQITLAEGVTEAQFLELFYTGVVKPDTIFVGYNNVRFDDEFIRFLNYRNFYDAYEWQWKNNCSRWDLLDLTRMTRALRPHGIKWPFASDGKPANRLGLLADINGLQHDNAHDALSDVQATIALARLLKEKQPDIFDYQLNNHDKKSVKSLVEKGAPFVYTSGRYSSQYLHTTAAVILGKHSEQEAALVYDLRFDPTPFIKMDVSELIEAWKFTKDPDALRLPIKTIKYNRCPTIAPLGVIKDAKTQQALELDLDKVSTNLKLLKEHYSEFGGRVAQAVAELDKQREAQQTSLADNQLTVDSRLYEGFMDGGDKSVMLAVRTSKPADLAELEPRLQDARLKSLLPLYKARNYPSDLNPEERIAWDEFCAHKLLDGGTESRVAKYGQRLRALAEGKITDEKRYLLQELQLYAESILPAGEAG